MPSPAVPNRLTNLLLLGFAAAVPSFVAAQPPRGNAQPGRNRERVQGFQMADSPELAEAVNALLADDGAHMRMAPRRAEVPTDAFRAKRLVLDARDALSKYKDVRVAEADGYEKFLPFLENQSIFHYNSIENVGLTLNRFDVTRPVSLLYKKNEKGEMVLVGAMYSAPPEATVEQLDARLPTSIAHWHEHVDFCAPNPRDVRAGTVKIDGPTTAKWLKITTREACDAAGGQFVPRLFGWMAHVYLFASDDPKVIWGGEHGAMDTHVHKP